MSKARAVRERALALEWIDRALRKAPASAEARLLRARLLAEDGRPQVAAKDCLDAANGFLPSFGEAVEVARLLDADDAVTVLRVIRRRDPSQVEARVALADALRRAGSRREAAALFRALGARLPKDRRIPSGLGRTLFAEGDYAAAVAAFDAALKLGEQSGELHAERGEALMQLRRYADAAAAYRQALRASVEHTPWRLNLGIALAAQGPALWAEAEPRFREVLAMDSGNTRAWEELQRLGTRF